MTFDQFMNKMYEGSIHATDSRYGDERLGQWFFNFLNLNRPDIAEKLRGSLIDPFYKNRIPADVVEFVRNAW